jgi:hypothetical protein
MTLTTATLDRAAAIRRIADHLADQDAFVITVPPHELNAFGHSIKNVQSWTAYLDNGTGHILRTDTPGALLVAELLFPTAAVVVVPKTVPATVLSEALGQEVPADGSRDIVILTSQGGPTYYPMLFINALDIVSPSTAALLRANHLPNLS